MKPYRYLALTLCMLAYPTIQFGQTLAGTDELGRKLLHNSAVGDPLPNRHVGMFYFLWIGDNTAEDAWDLNEIIPKHPEVLEDFDHEQWGNPKKPGRFYFWGKPIYDYYRSDDYWVALRSMQLLTDAGVDFVVIDATNYLIYAEQADVLMKAMDAIRAQGKNPPKIVFYTNTRSGDTMQKAYDHFYKEGAPYRHPECWLYLDGKPLIIGISAQAKGSDYEKFFTIRESQWPNEDQKVNGWPWISFTRPQKAHYNERGEAEIINVSVAQHPNHVAGMGGSAFYGNNDNWGRSFRNDSHGNPEKDIIYGYNFQEQWDYALTQNTPYIFVTGWNEWVAGRWASTDDNPEHSWFCDQATPEYSRDIEPTLTAGMKDNYYMQLVNNIRRYKGTKADVISLPVKPIKTMADWSDIPTAYIDYTGETQDREHPGAQSKPIVVYTNNTGRNDFHFLKTAHDEDNLFFYTETVDPITSEKCDDRLRLYIDTDRSIATGWYGYDYRIIGGSSLQQYINKQWKDVKKTEYRIDGNKMMIRIPLVSMNLTNEINLEYKWTDNMQQEDPMDWYINGDCAPGARFNCVYKTK